MKSFKNFKDYVFRHCFPEYYQENDTYPDENGKGILERFIQVCMGYLDEHVTPDIDNFIDILDVEKTPHIFLNYLWEYFGYIPYAYGVITRGEPYTKENVAKWLNSAEGFPKADTRKILKYAIALYKIRCTEDFYTILGRFYGVRFELSYTRWEKPHGKKIIEPTIATMVNKAKTSRLGDDWMVSSYNGVSATYNDYKLAYRLSDCYGCVQLYARIHISQGMYEILEREGTLEYAKKALLDIINKYLPIWVRPFTTETVEFLPTIPELLIGAPPHIPTKTTSGALYIPLEDTQWFRLSLDKTNMNLLENDKPQMVKAIVVIDDTDKPVKWISLNPSVVKVSPMDKRSATITPVAPGSTEVVAIIGTGRATIKITVGIDSIKNLMVMTFEEVYSTYEDQKSGFRIN